MHETTTATPATNIFGPIALSLSGGGYRAATFHLGTLEMLDKLALLKDVKYLSTVSGGSIVGAFYAVRGQGDFSGFRTSFETFLLNNAIKIGLDNLLSEPFVKEQGQMPSLMRAAACVYDSEHLYNGKTLADIAAVGGHLDEVIINATEMRGGGSFRFVQTSNKCVNTGKNELHVDDEIANVIRIADAVASSSCFPGGFEPIRFPSDFIWPDGMTAGSVKRVLGSAFDSDLPLMDGGIFDNQGIDSIDNIFDRVNSDIGLFIISDTSPRSEGLELAPAETKGMVPLLVWRWFIGLFGLLSLLSAVLIVTDKWPRQAVAELGPLHATLTYFLPVTVLTVLFLIIAGGLWGSKKLVEYARKKTGIDVWFYLRRLSIAQLISLVKSRLDSVLELTTATFMTRIRRLGYSQMYKNPKITRKLLPNIIYDIDNESKWEKVIADSPYKPKDAIRNKVKQAEAYGTNLWFLDTAERDNLIYCGRATITFKLLKYMLEMKAVEIAVPSSEEKKFFDRLVAEWAKFNV